MDIEKLLAELYKHKVVINIDNGKLKMKIPKGVSIDYLKDEIGKKKEEIIALFKNIQTEKQSVIGISDPKDYYPLSSAQRRMYLLQQMDLESIVYNMPYSISIGADADKEKIEDIFNQLISRHESFRTSFEIPEEEPVQYIHEKVEFKIEKITIESSEEQAARNNFKRAFDLSKAPLLRVAIVEIKGSGNLLLMDMHHIISDGVSHSILEQEFRALYSGEELPPIRLQYKDYSEWQNSEERQLIIKQQEDFWIRKFEREIPALNLPLDYVRPVIQTYEGANVNFALSKEETQKIKSLSNENGLTLYMTILSVYTILLSKLSQQEDIIVGTPTAGRNHVDLKRIVGVFINTLAIRNDLKGDKTVLNYLQELKRTTQEVFENQDYQFEDLVEQISVERDMSRNPVFDVMFNLLNQTEYTDDLSGLDRNLYIHKPSISKFDLTLSGVDYGDQLMLNFEYSTKLFKAETIERFIKYFKQIVNQIVQNLDKNLSELEIIDQEEKQQLLYEFNNTKTDYPKDKTIHRLFQEQVERTPENVAIHCNGERISYKELNNKSDRLASHIHNLAGENSIIGIMTDRSIEMIIGILAVMKSGNAYLPLDLKHPQDRNHKILKESEVTIVLSDQQDLQLDDINVINLLNSEVYSKNTISESKNTKSTDPAYVIYTSGSTGVPKGVMISHRSVINLVKGISGLIPENNSGTILSLTTISFDIFGLELYTPLLNGFSMVLAKDEDQYSAEKIASIVQNQDVNILQLTPSRLGLILADEYSKEIFKEIKVLFVGGEELPSRLLSNLCELYKGKVYNMYGPTETTIWSTYKDVSGDLPLNIGKPVNNTQVYILGLQNELTPIGVSGELCISGDGLAIGYLHNSELTREKFIENPYKSGERLYKTGDLACWLPDGNIAFLGRIDSQVKIRGFRIELGEIENALQQHENIKESVVTAREENGDKYLCAYLVTEEDLNQEEIRTYLSESLPDYMIPLYFVELEKIPLTANGKVNRKALPAPEIKAGDDYAAPANATEEKLVQIWSKVLKIPVEEISVAANFFSLGGHSLRATILTSKIHKELGVKILLAEIFKLQTVRKLSKYIKEATKIDYSSIDLIAKRDYYHLSSAQRRLYFLQRLDLGSTSYNMPIVMPWNENVDIEHLESIFRRLIIRHESLRTSIVTINNEPVQKIQDEVDFHLDYFETSNQEEAESLIKEYIKPFNLTEAPLLRSCIIKFHENKHVWVVDMHHIISDGTSSSLLIDDFMSFYNGEQLKPLKLQYKDFSGWQNKLIANAEIKTQEKYWTDLLSGDIPVLQLPPDFNRPQEFSFEGDIQSFVLENEVALKFRELGTKNSATLFMNMLAALNVLFYKYTSQTDIIIGSGIAGRPHADLQNIVGMFVNTLAMRNYPDGEKTYTDFLKEVASSSVKAFENQNVQFEDLVDKLDVERDTSRNPLFDIFMIVQNFGDAKRMQVNEEVVRDIRALNEPSLDVDYKNTTSKFDMTFYVNEQGENIYLNIEYYTRIFKKETILRLVSCFNNILKEVIKNPEIKLKDIELLSQEEKEQLLYKFNDTRADYPKDKTIHEIFEEQVDKNPDNIALVCDQEKITYRELDHRSNQLAHYLRFECEVSKDESIGVYMDKGANVIIAILGILKSGCGYLPLSVTNPEERIIFIINDTSTRVIISEKQYVKEMNKFQWECSLFRTYLCLDSYKVNEEQEAQNRLNDRKLWEYVGDESVDEVTGGGWTSSYTGKPIPQEEMDEYGDNVLKKLEPLITSQTRILEIGCASGITMFRLAPKVDLYYGTDLSGTILKKNEERINSEGHTNIIQKRLSADEIDQIEEKDFDLVIINSVIQCFDGHNYLKKVIRKAIDLMKPEGLMFFGDIMDQDLKKDLVKEFEGFRQINKTKDYKTKIDWSEELFLSRGFWDDLKSEETSIKKIECTPKIFTLENELTKFRYDVLVSINKNQEKRLTHKAKNKQQHDLNILKKYSIDSLPNINTPENLAYIIYTSGTTGKPKGVMVEHRNVVRLFFNDKFQFDFSENDIWTMFHSHSFDFSVWEMFGALLYGGKLVVIPNIVAKDVVKYYNILCEEKVTVLNQTPSAFYNLAEVALSNSEKSLDKLKYVIFGGEALKPNKLKAWFDVYSDVKLINMYGITETTVHVTYKKIGKYEIENNISNIGTPIPTLTTYIMNSDLKLVPIGIAGELLIGGDGVSRGYLGQEELTREKFVTNPYNKEERLYRSGDLVKMLSNGEMEYLGRIDNQVQLRGFRIELGEIENVLQKYENIKESVVIAREDDGDKYLCAYVVCEDEFKQDEVRTYLLEYLPDYMIPSYFVKLEKIPLTTNGKVNRKALPSPEVKAGDDYAAPSNKIEEKLVEIWSEVLNIPQKEISTTVNFFTIGGHSLKATVLTSKIHKEIGVEFPLRDVFLHSTIKSQASEIAKSTKKEFVSIAKVTEQDYYPLSSAQKRLYLLQDMDKDSIVYNIPYIIPLGAEVDKEKIEKVFHQLISRHESFRTSFEIKEENPVQRIHEQVHFTLEEITINKEKSQNLRLQYIQAFDLSQAPLLRVTIVNVEGEESKLMIDMHHIISDGVSHSILEREFQRLYLGEELLPLSLQYKDYSQWQNSAEQKARVKNQEEYWTNKFEGEITVLNLPNDFNRPAMQSHEGATVSFALSNEQTENLKTLAKENGLTLYMAILAAFNILLSKLSGQEDIIVGTPIAGRSHADLENIVGMFVNTLAIRNEVNGSYTIKEFLRKLEQNTLEAYENQDYQFEDLVEKVSVERDISRNPLFDVMFSLLNQTEYKGDLSGLDGVNYVHKQSISMFDLTLTAVDYGDQLMLSFEYCIKLFKADTIELFISYFREIIRQLPENTNKKLSTLDLLSKEQKNLLLHEFNDTQSTYPKDKKIYQLFEEQAEKTPDHIAIVKDDISINYGELDKKINQLSNGFLAKGFMGGNKIGVLIDRSIESIISVFGVLKSGCIYLPIDKESPQERLNHIIKDSDLDCILDPANSRNNETELTVPVFSYQNILYTKDFKSSRNTENESLAYILYTSGTTGNPKGVLIGHQSLTNLITTQIFNYQLNTTDRVLQFSTLSFDASLEQIGISLLSGSQLVLIEKEKLLDIDKFYFYITKNNITHLDVVPTFLSELDPENCQSLKRMVVGGDVCEKVLAKKWSHKLSFYNAYGPTETTITSIEFKVAFFLKDSDKLSIGKPLFNTEIYILDKYNNLQLIGVSGELCISGDGLALGYINNPELTREKFIDHPFKKGEKLYRTGDLARWLPDGNIEFLGRIDSQVKIRGFRIELGEIENVLQKHASIKESVVIVNENNDDKYLCAYIVAEKEFNQEDIRTYLSASLPDYMIPSYFVELKKIPLTTNGKVDRKSLPAPAIKAGNDYEAPSNEIEEKLVEIWSEVLNIPQKEISTTSNFFAIGGHSLKATVLTATIHKTIGVEFPLRDVFLHTSIKAQASQIKISTKKEFVSIPKAKEQSYYSLSSAQKRMYLLQQMDLESIVYNMPYSILIGADTDKDKYEEIFSQLISRHESFRTSFEIPEENPVQRIHEKVDFKMEKFTIEKSEEQITRDKFIRAFDLSKAPLLRVAIVEIKGSHNLLLIDMHHIICDGVSHSILDQEFQSLYSGKELSPLKLQYKDYSEWQNSEERQLKVKEQEDYWIKKFEGEIPVLNLPLDYVRPVIQSYEGAHVHFTLSKEETLKIKSLSRENDLTLYMTILSVYTILLSKLSQQEDIVIGTPMAGRNHDDLKNVVGVFVNTLAIRNELKPDKTVQNYLQELKRTTLEVFENQDYQFEDLVEKISVERNLSRNPVFDVMFNLLNQTEYPGDLSTLDGNKYIHKPSISKFDLTLLGVEYEDQLILNLEYCTKLFTAETIERYIKYFKQIVNQITQNSEKNLSELEIISEDEKQELLYEFNNAKCDYPKDKTIQQLFEEQVRRMPDKIALTFERDSLSYHELNDKANSIANDLRKNGISRDDVVIIFLDRSSETVFSMLGILKSGGAYLPIDPDYPDERIDFILNDSHSKTVITTKELSKRIEFDGNIICLEEMSKSSDSTSNIESINKPSDLSYIIYTSGTTGKPKGVMIEHRNVVRLFFNDNFQFNFSEKDVWTMFHSHCFDFSVWEMYGALLYGGKLIVIPKLVARDAVEYFNVLCKEKVTILNQTPSAFYNLAQVVLSQPNKSLENLRYLIFGGEALKPNKLKEWFNIHSEVKLINMFGITETTVHVTYKEIGKHEIDNNISNIGTPIPTLTTYVVDKNLKLVPKGVSGELLIGGDGVSRGYLGKEELTSEKFIMNPYNPEERLYRSGDLVKILSNGEMEYLGRIDNQVQLRGFRIEPGEIENVLQKHENVKECVVIAKEENGNKYLCAYIVSENIFDQEEIHSFLSAMLPDYMIPSYFVEMKEFPLTGNGKVNRKALPSLEIKAGDNYVAATNPLEEQLVKIWEEVLNIQPIGVTDNFYKIGGNSLLAITLLNKIEKKLGERIQLSIFLQHLTIKDLSTFIYQLFSWSANFHLDESVIKNKNVISSVKIANLQTKGENLPLFFVAPLGGILPATSIVGIMDLPLLLGEDQPFYSIQVPPLFSDLAQTISTVGELNLSDYNFKEDIIQQFVKECIQSIKTIYKGEQIYIGGFCTGSIFAMELAAQIEKSGIKVKEVFLIDPPLKENFSDNSKNKQFSQIADLNFDIEDIAWFIAKDIGWKENINIEEVISLLKNTNSEEIWEVGINILKSNKTVSETTSFLDLKISYYTKFYNQELITTYLSVIDYKYPKIEAEKTTLIIAGVDEVIKNKGFLDIVSKYLKNNVTFENITGDHGSVFQQPNINQLVEIIKRNINSNLN